jgi:hypothetical protein
LLDIVRVDAPMIAAGLPAHNLSQFVSRVLGTLRRLET